MARDAAICALGLAIGFGAFAVTRNDGSGRPRVDDRRSVAELDIADGNDAPGPGSTAPSNSAAGAPTPEAAVDRFFAAERRDDFTASFAQLSASDRERYGSAAAWVQAHRDIPEITGFAITGVEATAGSAKVNVDLSLRAVLDEVVGLTPARATAGVRVVADPDGWRVEFSQSTLAPQYLDDDGADDAVAAWARARQACEEPAEWAGGLLGIAADARADALCRTDGEIRVTDPVPLDAATGTEAVLAAFGPEASIWARVVTVQTPQPLPVVAAPVGDEWLVVGVAESADPGP